MSISIHAGSSGITTLNALERGLTIGTLGGHPRVYLDTALVACGIAATMTDAELRDWETGADEVRIR